MTGIEARHGANCPAKGGKRCTKQRGCGYRGYVYHAGKPERGPWKSSQDDAKTWRINRLNEIKTGRASKPTAATLQSAWERWLALAEEGVIRTRSGGIYKASALRDYDGCMRTQVIPRHGNLTLSKIDRAGLQRLVDRLVKADLSASRVRSTINAFRVLYRDVDRIVPGGMTVDPTDGLRLPSLPRTERRRTTPAQVGDLIAALPAGDRPLWSVFFYAGLRLGEAQALRWSDVDLTAGVIHVRAGWDRKSGKIEPKSRAGRRQVPMAAAVRGLLEPMRGDAESLVFGRGGGRPFNATTYTQRADRIWGERRVTPHEARATYGALMLAAGTSMKALQTYMGHASINVTFDIYAHLLEGTEALDAGRLDALLAA